MTGPQPIPTDGAAAFRRHATVTACPYGFASPERFRWLAEWHEALADFARANHKPVEARRASTIAASYREQVRCAALTLQAGDGR